MATYICMYIKSAKIDNLSNLMATKYVIIIIIKDTERTNIVCVDTQYTYQVYN